MDDTPNVPIWQHNDRDREAERQTDRHSDRQTDKRERSRERVSYRTAQAPGHHTQTRGQTQEDYSQSRPHAQCNKGAAQPPTSHQTTETTQTKDQPTDGLMLP
mmetsp:Transcript_22080/g.54258  ORF Transcript_22080/g.54258 Transcript_22080/m.54258 type:complete len:103 (-) Transcript_22080:640-948(-)